jgi:hypothetical protein
MKNHSIVQELLFGAVFLLPELLDPISLKMITGTQSQSLQSGMRNY